MKVKIVNGKVEFLLKAGTHLVKDSSTKVGVIQEIIDHGRVEDSDISGYNIKVTSKVGNEVFYFNVVKPKRKKADEETVQ